MSLIRPRSSRINIRVDATLRQAIEAVAKEMDCSVSMAARYMLGEALAFRHIEASGKQYESADHLIRHIAALEVRAFRRGDYRQFLHDVNGILRAKGIKCPWL